jgi:hypothetical protein
MFHYFKIPYFTCTLFTKFTYNEYIRAYFLSHVVLRFSPVNSLSTIHTFRFWREHLDGVILQVLFRVTTIHMKHCTSRYYSLKILFIVGLNPIRYGTYHLFSFMVGFQSIFSLYPISPHNHFFMGRNLENKKKLMLVQIMNIVGIFIDSAMYLKNRS